MSLIAFNLSLGICFMLMLALLVETAKNPIVETKLGKVKGKTERYEGQKYEQYLGIPYGKPPVKENRWEKPKPVNAWNPLTIDATKYSVHCTQFIAKFYNFVGMGRKTSEDCLYLNIFVPGSVKNLEETKLPVVFYTFGGGYVLGTGAMYPGHVMALQGQVIVVTFNYRVGTIGWISTGDSALPGNYGLWDTKLALEWVKEHIGSFGGNADQITVMGQSAGAAITSHMMISSQTNKLFKNAVCLSGTSSGYFGVVTQPLQLSMLLANLFECNQTSTQDIENCLRKVDAETLDFYGALAQKKLLNCNPTLLPNIDGEFLQQPARDAFQTEAGKNIHLLTGSLQHDGAAFVIKNPLGMNRLKKNHSATSHESLRKHMRQWWGFLENKDEIIDRFLDYYPDMRSDDLTTRTKGTVKGMTEAWFGAASNWEAKIHSSYNRSSTYHYLFKYRQTFLHGYPEWLEGSHMDDLYSVFGDPFLEQFRKTILLRKYKPQDRVISDNFMALLTNFAHSSNPNIGPNKPVTEWRQYNDNEKNYLEISQQTEEKTFHDNDMSKNYDFQMDTFNHYVYPPLPTFDQLKLDQAISQPEIDKLIEEFKIDLLETYQFLPNVDEVFNYFKNSRLAFIQRNNDL